MGAGPGRLTMTCSTDLSARTRLVTEMVPAHITHVGPDLVCTYSNRRLSSVMPGSLSDIVGRPVREVLEPETFARIEPRLLRALEGEASVFEITHEPSGRRIRIALTPDQGGTPGQPQAVYALSMDVTEETQARAALAQTAKRELAAQLAHIKTRDFMEGVSAMMAKRPPRFTGA